MMIKGRFFFFFFSNMALLHLESIILNLFVLKLRALKVIGCDKTRLPF